LTGIVDNFQRASEGLNDSSKALGSLLHDTQLADDLKTILKNLNAGSQKLDEDLEALQHNFLLRGFFRKKAKQEKK
jgi:phospholipid/cholesterol/gamma-HCH transport system substrate-binding protein